MKIAVFGTSGMLGTEVTSLFKSAGHELLTPCLDELDLTRKGDLERFFKAHEFEGVVNCSAYTAVDDCEDPIKYSLALRINGEAVGELARFSKAVNCWVIHVSTDYVFDGSSDQPYREDDCANPINAYGRSKWEGERQFLMSGTPGWIVRTSWLYGPNGKNFVKTIQGLLKNRVQIDVVNDQFGSPTHTGSLAAFMLLLAEQKPTKGIYQYSNEGVTSWHGLACAIRDEMGIQSCIVNPVPSHEYISKAKRPKNSSFNLSKARAVPGAVFEPWREALKKHLICRI